MKNKKKVKLAASKTLATGVFKKRKWPWLFVLLAAVIAAALYSMIAVEFFFFKKCDACTTYYAYTFHYESIINKAVIVIAALVLLAILCAILFIRKRTLLLTATHIIYTRGRKTKKIALSSIEYFDAGSASITVKVPFKKFKFAKLKNKKQFYDALSVLLNTPITTGTSSVTGATVALPTTTESKIRYFQSLLAAKIITPEQFDKYTNTVLTTDFPTLY